MILDRDKSLQDTRAGNKKNIDGYVFAGHIESPTDHLAAKSASLTVLFSSTTKLYVRTPFPILHVICIVREQRHLVQAPVHPSAYQTMSASKAAAVRQCGG